MTERREGDRRRTYLSGRITFNDRVSTMDCLIRNLSRNGAMLEFPGPAMPPHELDLCILGRAESRRGRLVWYDGVRAGVETDPVELGAVIPLETARLIRRLKTERAILAKRVAQLREPV